MPLHLDIIPQPSHDEHPIRLLQLSDPHLLENKQDFFAGIQPFKSLQMVIEHSKRHLPFDCILSTGDIAQQPSQQTYLDYLEEVAVFNLPHYWIRGNHDDNGNFPDLSPSEEPEIILIGQWCLIMLNSQKQGCVHGEISPMQLEYLAQALHKYHNYFTVIALHHNTFPVGCKWLDQHSLQNQQAFLDCIQDQEQVKMVLSGHVHQEFSHRHRHIDFLSCPSTCIQFKPQSEEFCLDSQPPGYRIIELYANGNYSTKILRLSENIGEIDYKLCEY